MQANSPERIPLSYALRRQPLREYNQVVGIIGGGTGLEALQAAEKYPEAFIVVIDPLARFGRRVIDQLADLQSRHNPTYLEWGFFEKDDELKTNYPGLVAAKHTDHRTWHALEEAFLRYKSVGRQYRERMYFLEQPIFALDPDVEIFDHAFMTYPDKNLCGDYSQFDFMQGALKDNGTLYITTEQWEIQRRYEMYGGSSVDVKGSGIREVHEDPISAFDFILGPNGYYFIDIEKKDGRFPKPPRAFFNTNQNVIGHMLLSITYPLYRGRLHPKKR